MSLHTLAQHLQSAGRGQDKVLVHMTPGEVNGLQSLAQAHGGSLTRNPHTGLPEAGFLSSLLPMLAGGALTFLSGGALSPLMSSMLVGGVGAAATGSLGKGLMMGLGAYGGAGLASGLESAGASELAAAQPVTSAGLGSQVFPVNSALATQAEAPAMTEAAQVAQAAPQSALPPIDSSNRFASAVSNTTPVGAPEPAQSEMLMAQPQLSEPIPDNTAFVPSTDISAPSGPSPTPADPTSLEKLKAGFGKATGSWEGLKDVYAAGQAAAPYSGLASLGSSALGSYYDQKDAMQKAAEAASRQNQGLIRPYEYTRTLNPDAFAPRAPMWSAHPGPTSERNYFTENFKALTPYKAPGPEYAAAGGLMGMAVGGPVEEMSAQNAVGDNSMYPQSQLHTPMYSNPMVQRPMPTNVIKSGLDTNVDPYTGEEKMAAGGLSSLGGYSDGGRLLKGPGDGVSDSIPAVIGDRQPARLADGEFVIPARIVSELGNGSTDAGAKRLYEMMAKVQNARRKTVGKEKVATNTNAAKYLPQ